jgi:hypothetical protein
MREHALVNADAIEGTFLDHELTAYPLTSESKWQAPLPDYGNVLLVGVLDIYIEALGAIYDLKMTKSAEFMDEDQLCFYSMMGALLGRETSRAGFIVPLREPRVVETSFGAEEILALKARIADGLEIIEAGLETGRWEARFEEGDCPRCPVARFCEAMKAAAGVPAEV